MEFDKKKLDAGLKKAVDIGTNIINTGVPIAGKVVNTGIDILSSLLGGNNGTDGTGTSGVADYNKPYTPSNSVTQLGKDLNAATKPVQKPSQWQDTLQQTMDAILNKGDFKYDVNADALYNQYKDQYILGGQMAMQDSMGQAAVLTGGYGNSNAQTVGQQQYQVYLQQLTDKIPELYQLARDSYDRDLSNLYNRYGLLSDAEAKEYSRYRDEVSDFYADRDYLTNRYYNERDFDYGQWADNRDFAYAQHRDAVADKQWQDTFDRNVYESDRNYNRGVYESDRNYNYQVGRDAEADRQWQAAFDRGVYESDRNYDYTISRDAVADKQWQAAFDRSIIESDRDYSYKTSRAAATDAQWQKEYELALKKANTEYSNVITGDFESSHTFETSIAESFAKSLAEDIEKEGGMLSEKKAKGYLARMAPHVNSGSITADDYKYILQKYGL